MNSTTERDGSASHLIMLDGLRGVAALFVVAHHLELAGFDFGLFSRAYLAVDFFFMLSGFVLSRSYDHRFAIDLDWLSFMKLRLSRLWPTMAMGIALGVAVAWGGAMAPGLLAIRAATALLFIPLAIDTVHVFVLNGVQCSLFFELFANALHGGPLKRVPSASLGRLLFVSVLLLFGIAYLHGDLTVGHVKTGWIGGFGRVLAAYCTGMLLYRLWRKVSEEPPKANAGLVLAALIMSLMAPALFPSSWWWVDPFFVVAAFPAVLWLGANALVAPRWQRLAAFGGTISYPLYAFHMPLLGLSQRLGDAIGGQGGKVLRITAVVLAIGLAWLWSKATWRVPQPSIKRRSITHQPYA